MLKIMQNDKGMNGRLTVLVTGCDGQLGSEIRKLAKSGDCSFCRFLFVDVNVLDICNRAEVHNYFKTNHVDVVVNCAAYTAVDKAELEPEAAFHLSTYIDNLCKNRSLGYANARTMNLLAKDITENYLLRISRTNKIHNSQVILKDVEKFVWKTDLQQKRIGF